MTVYSRVQRLACLALALLAVAGAGRAAQPKERVLPLAGWQSREYLDTVKLTPLPGPVEADGGTQLSLPLTFPGDSEFVTPLKQPWYGWDELCFEVDVPDDLPPGAWLYVFVKDWDDLWLQVKADVLTRGGRHTYRIPISGAAATEVWKPKGHFRPWHQLTPGQLVEYGLKFAYPPDAVPEYKGTAVLRHVLLQRDETHATAPPRISGLRCSPADPRVGCKLEVSFRVNLPFRNPFSRDQVKLQAVITAPDGSTEAIPAFYFEDFLFDEASYESQLVPYGMPEFRVRYTPLQEGEYRLDITGEVEKQTVTLPSKTVTVGPAETPFKGFLRVSKEDRRFLVHSRDGSEFWGIGVNVRSPYDNRYVQSFPFSQWPYYNLNMYQDLFRTYAANGINFVEVWMSPWWLGLEWIPDAPGNHGIGYMNQWRAWKLDRLLEWAEENGLYVLLLLNNHGKFSAWCDADWQRNPFNKANGGHLVSPTQYFFDPAAKAAFKHFADYLTARWGYSPRLLGWKLFSEIDLTGHDREWFKSPAVRDWHREMGRYMKQVDPNKHLVTTHWADNYSLVNPSLALIPELDFLTLDAYYHGRGAVHLFKILDGTASFADQMRKPCIITEFGGTPFADSTASILRQLHLGIWQGFFDGLATTPCFWWFPLLEEKDLYHHFKALRRFTDDEPRLKARRGRQVLDDQLFTLSELRYPDHLLCWVFDNKYFFRSDLNDAVTHHHGRHFTVSGLPAGAYAVEFWNCSTGAVIGVDSLRFTVDNEPGVVNLPPFERDIAVKIKPVSTGAEE